jgi:transcription antitermination factor NusG
MGIEYYLPLYKKVYVRPGETTRKRTFILPLFPGYIAFAQDTPHDIYKTGRVANLIEVRNQRHFIRELSQIYQALECGYNVAPVDQPFELGAEVEITSGLLKGIRGRVAEIRSHQYLVITVSGLGRAIVKVEESQMKTMKEDQE